MAFGQGANFNDQGSGDPTSAPPMPQSPVQALAQRKKQKNPRNPTDLARAIAISKRARQGSHKYGS